MSRTKEYFKALEDNNTLEHSIKVASMVMNHKTINDVAELIEKKIKENQRIKKSSINEQTNTIAQSRINQLSDLLTELKKLKV